MAKTKMCLGWAQVVSSIWFLAAFMMLVIASSLSMQLYFDLHVISLSNWSGTMERNVFVSKKNSENTQSYLKDFRNLAFEFLSEDNIPSKSWRNFLNDVRISFMYPSTCPLTWSWIATSLQDIESKFYYYLRTAYWKTINNFRAILMVHEASTQKLKFLLMSFRGRCKRRL